MEDNSSLHRLLASYLEHAGRGAATEICSNTSLTISDISNWTKSRRGLPAHKLVEAVSWLIDTNRLSIEAAT